MSARYASSETLKSIKTMAATNVESEIIESKRASWPEFISDEELTFLPTFLT